MHLCYYLFACILITNLLRDFPFRCNQSFGAASVAAASSTGSCLWLRCSGTSRVQICLETPFRGPKNSDDTWSPSNSDVPLRVWLRRRRSRTLPRFNQTLQVFHNSNILHCAGLFMISHLPDFYGLWVGRRGTPLQLPLCPPPSAAMRTCGCDNSLDAT